jgi:hypothetical protein
MIKKELLAIYYLGDKEDLSTYVCTGSLPNGENKTKRVSLFRNPSGTRFICTIQTDIDIILSNSNDNKQQFSSDNSKISLGDKISLKCSSSSNINDFDIPVRWRFPSHSTDVVIKDDNILTIDSVMSSNFGVYECFYSIDDIYYTGHLNLTTKINLDEKSLNHLKSPPIPTPTPTISTSFMTESTIENNDEYFNIKIIASGSVNDGYLKFICEANFAFDFKWIKNNGYFSSNVRIDNNILHFDSFYPIDVDIYTCVAKSYNTVRNKSLAFDYNYNYFILPNSNEIVEKASPQIIEIYQHGLAELNNKFELECVVNSFGEKVYFLWLFNSVQVNRTRTNKLAFNSLEERDGGDYTCRVYNSYGYDSKVLSLAILNKVTRTTTTTTTTTITTTTTTTIITTTTTTTTTIAVTTKRPEIVIKKNKIHKQAKIQILSDPHRDHIENGMIKLKCSSDIKDGIYNWTLIHGPFSENTFVDKDILLLKPFTRKNVGIYKCTVHNIEKTIEATRRININLRDHQDSSSINSDSMSKTSYNNSLEPLKNEYIFDISNKIRINMISPVDQLKRGGNIQLKCSIDDPYLKVVWLKRGGRFSARASLKHEQDQLNNAILQIKNFQKHDLGVYICRARLGPRLIINHDHNNNNNNKVLGESHYYLMASDLKSFDIDDQILYGPDLEIKKICNKDGFNCDRPFDADEPILLQCEVGNFGNSHLFFYYHTLNLNSIELN